MSVDVEKIASTEERVEAALGELKKYLDGKNEGSVELVAFIDLVDLYAARDNYRLYFHFSTRVVSRAYCIQFSEGKSWMSTKVI